MLILKQCLFLIATTLLLNTPVFAISSSGIGEGKEVVTIEDCGKTVEYGFHSIQLTSDRRFRLSSPSGKYSGKYEVAIPGEKLSLSLSKNSKTKLYDHIGQSGKSLCKVKGKVLSPKVKKLIVKIDREADTLKVLLEVKYKATNGSDKLKSRYKVIASAAMAGEASLRSGVFFDAPVTGLHYASPSSDGITSEDGVFQYKKGEWITFHLGGLKLGEAKGQTVITPLDLYPRRPQYQVALMSFLQTLDQDGVLENGIQLAPSIGSDIDGYFNVDAGSTYTFPSIVADDGYPLLAGLLSNSSDWLPEVDAHASFEAEIAPYLKNGQYTRPSDDPDPTPDEPTYYHFTDDPDVPFIVFNEEGETVVFITDPATGRIQSIIITDPAEQQLAFFFGEDGTLSGISDGTTSATVGEVTDEQFQMFFMDEDGATEMLLSVSQTTASEVQGIITIQANNTTLPTLPTVVNCVVSLDAKCGSDLVFDIARLVEVVYNNRKNLELDKLNKGFLKNWKKIAVDQLVETAADGIGRINLVEMTNGDDVASILVSLGYCGTTNKVACLELFYVSGLNFYKFLKLNYQIITDETLCNFWPTYFFHKPCVDLAPTPLILSGTSVLPDTSTEITGLGIEDEPSSAYPEVCSKPYLEVHTPPELGSIKDNTITDNGSFIYTSPQDGGHVDEFKYQAIVVCDGKIIPSPTPLKVYIRIEEEGGGELTLSMEAIQKSYSLVGDIIDYSYKVTNTGSVVVEGPVIVSDGKEKVSCTEGSLAPDESETCYSTHTVIQADIDAGKIANRKIAIGMFGDQFVQSNEESLTVTCDCASTEVYTIGQYLETPVTVPIRGEYSNDLTNCFGKTQYDSGIHDSNEKKYAFLITDTFCRKGITWVAKNGKREMNGAEYSFSLSQSGILEVSYVHVISRHTETDIRKEDSEIETTSTYTVNLNNGSGSYTASHDDDSTIISVDKNYCPPNTSTTYHHLDHWDGSAAWPENKDMPGISMELERIVIGDEPPEYCSENIGMN